MQLEYIVAVDTHRHFVTAAQKCFVTQPTLSMQLKKLEEDLGVTLFDRTKQPIIPTEVGSQIIAQARRILSETNKIDEIIRAYNDTVSGNITIGIIPSLAPYLIPLFIGNFTKKYPEVEIKIVELLTDEIIRQLKIETIDVGILVTPLHEQGIIEQPLFYEEMTIFANNTHPFCNQNSIKVKELASPDLWLLNNGHCFRSQVINLCNYQNEAQSSSDHFEYESGSLETIKKLVAIEGGYTLMPELALDDSNKHTVTKYLDDSPLREVSLVYTRNYAKKRILNLITEEINNVIPEKMKDKNRGYVVEWK